MPANSTQVRQRRGHRDGTITHRADGRWEIRVKDPRTGRRVSRYAKTEAEARRTLRQMLATVESGELVVESGTRLADFAETWLAGPARHGRSESTLAEYERRLRKYVLPSLGERRLRELNVIDVETMLQTLADRGLGTWTVRGTRNALSAALRDAVRADQIRYNAAAKARLPELPAPSQRTVPDPERVLELLQAAKGTELESLLTLLVCTGCRVGEALGARWEDVDLVAGTWSLSRTTSRNRQGQVIVVRRTKTGRARTIPLTPEAVAALKRQRTHNAAQRLKAGSAWTEGDLLFPSAVGTARDPRNLRKPMRELCRSVGFEGSFHSLRHAFATYAASGTSLASLSKVLGHEKLATTSDLYSHLYQPDARKAVESVAAQVFGARMRTDVRNEP